MVDKTFIFYCFIEDTCSGSDFIEYFDTKEEALDYAQWCIHFMEEKQMKYSRIRVYNKNNLQNASA